MLIALGSASLTSTPRITLGFKMARSTLPAYTPPARTPHLNLWKILWEVLLQDIQFPPQIDVREYVPGEYVLGESSLYIYSVTTALANKAYA